ncbi:putative gag-pol protein [Nephila pilipes]|nr:putative gag-pol protein [Nephila pilipes]
MDENKSDPIALNFDNPNTEINRVAVKPPIFWRNKPKLWFLQLEAQFANSGISQDATKYNIVVAALDENVLDFVVDILSNPPEKYDTLKKALLNRLTDTEESRLKKLLTDLELGDKRPSDLLRQMKSLAGNSISDEIIKSLWLQRLPQQTQAILQHFSEFHLNSSLKLEKVPVFGSSCDIFYDSSTKKKRPYIPESFMKIVFNSVHNLAHPGIKATTKLLKSKFVWPSIIKDARTWTRSCLKCEKSKVTRHVQSPFQQYHNVSKRFTEINLDIIGPLPSSEGFRYCLTIIDRYCRWPEAIPLPDIRADNLLKGWIARFGTPLVITTDQGTQFEAQLFQELSKLIGFKRNRTTSYHPQANGCIERWHRTLKASIMCHENESWTRSLPIILLGLRTTWRADFQSTPAELLYGENIRFPCDFFEDTKFQPQSEFVQKLKATMKQVKPIPFSYNCKQKPFVFKDLKNCSHVFVRTDIIRQSLQLPYHGPYQVIKRSDKIFTLLIKNKNVNISIDRLKPCFSDNSPETDCAINHKSNPVDKPTSPVKKKIRCTCPAGKDPAFCKHTFALLHAIDDYIKKEMFSAPTERLQTWHQPRPTKKDPTESSLLFKCRCEKTPTPDSNKFAFKKMRGIFATPFAESVISVNKIRFDKTLSLPAAVCSAKIAFDIPNMNISEAFFFHQHYFRNIEELVEIEQRTVHQNSSEWRQERKLRITASDAKSIFSRVANFEALATQILKKKNSSIEHIPAVRYGLEMEDIVRSMVQHMHPQSIVRKTGLVIHPLDQYIAASPDGLIRSGEDYMLLEIKCIFKPDGSSLEELISKRSDFCLSNTNGFISLKRNHKYYFQIQCQLAVTNLQQCLFIIFCNNKLTKEKIYSETINFDCQLWEECLGKFRNFFLNFYLPLIME